MLLIRIKASEAKTGQRPAVVFMSETQQPAVDLRFPFLTDIDLLLLNSSFYDGEQCTITDFNQIHSTRL